MSWRFDTCGDHLALDFANTVSERESGQPIERLPAYRDVVEFCRQMGVIGDARARALLRLARAQPQAARAAHRRALRLRDALYALFTAVAREDAPAAADLEVLNRELSRLRVDETLALGWRDDDQAPDGCLGAVVQAAVLLATDPAERRRVRICEAPDCEWLFYDASKNRSRRWCDMRQCGNRMKARRHYARGKDGGA